MLRIIYECVTKKPLKALGEGIPHIMVNNASSTTL